ncbi:class F sortase [Pseudonocardia sp. ICBG601]|uniref:class F sortase n=1 Tax=Pseudonocardia sp. ICBG601 TaxID=2846759 RepID=UPI001CF64AC7|nr:class F sortase [Pseudonocardia sp. ICBG601]
MPGPALPVPGPAAPSGARAGHGAVAGDRSGRGSAAGDRPGRGPAAADRSGHGPAAADWSGHGPVAGDRAGTARRGSPDRRRRAGALRRVTRVLAPLGVLAATLLLADPAGAPEPGATAVASVPVTAPGSAPGALLPPGPAPLVRSEPVRLRVDRLGLDTEPRPMGLTADRSMEVPADAGTVGWYTGAPTPGEVGPAVLTAHVDWKGLPGAFADLDTLEPGDEIRVDRADGTSVVFAVRRVGRFPKAEFPTAEVYGDLDHAGLRLITCGGVFDRSARSYLDNVVVFADQVR